MWWIPMAIAAGAGLLSGLSGSKKKKKDPSNESDLSDGESMLSPSDSYARIGAASANAGKLKEPPGLKVTKPLQEAVPFTPTSYGPPGYNGWNPTTMPKAKPLDPSWDPTNIPKAPVYEEPRQRRDQSA